MENILKKIVTYKREEVRKLKEAASPSVRKILEEGRLLERYFEHALRSPELSVIAEVKRQSPSVGMIGDIPNPAELASIYADGGARAISVLTDQPSFGGSIGDLKDVRQISALPILRKDFTVDAIQIAEAADAGATAVLLIVAIVRDETKYLLQEAERMGIEALVEVANEEELKIALQSGARMIGVNNRDLRTFEINTEKALILKEFMPAEIVSVAASGMRSVEDTKKVRMAGYDAVLIGQTLVESSDPKGLITKIRGMK